MPDPIPPIMNADSFDLETALNRAARSIIALRHPNIDTAILDDVIENDDDIRQEYDNVLETLHQPIPRRMFNPWFKNFGQPGGDS